MRYFFFFFITSYTVIAQTIWTGSTITFTKPNNGNASLAVNQDKITPNVWLTRGVANVLYNAVSQTAAPTNGYNSPLDTEWAEGTTANIADLLFTDFKTAAPKTSNNTVRVKDMVGKNYVLHLISDNIYIDLKILSWSTRQQGAGFSYERSTNQNLSILDVDSNPKINIYPNPASDFIALNNLKMPEDYHIYTVLGTKVMSGVIAEGQKIDVSSLNSGVYFIDADSITLFFIKE